MVVDFLISQVNLYVQIPFLQFHWASGMMRKIRDLKRHILKNIIIFGITEISSLRPIAIVLLLREGQMQH